MSEIMFAMMGVDIPTLKSEKKICITDFKRQCITWCDFLIIFYFCSNYFKIKQNLSCKLLSYITFNNQVDETHDNLLAGGLNRKEALDCLAFNLNDTVICKWRNEIASEENCEIEPCSILKLMKTLLKIQTLDNFEKLCKLKLETLTRAELVSSIMRNICTKDDRLILTLSVKLTPDSGNLTPFLFNFNYEISDLQDYFVGHQLDYALLMCPRDCCYKCPKVICHDKCKCKPDHKPGHKPEPKPEPKPDDKDCIDEDNSNIKMDWQWYFDTDNIDNDSINDDDYEISDDGKKISWNSAGARFRSVPFIRAGNAKQSEICLEYVFGSIKEYHNMNFYSVSRAKEDILDSAGIELKYGYVDGQPTYVENCKTVGPQTYSSSGDNKIKSKLSKINVNGALPNAALQAVEVDYCETTGSICAAFATHLRYNDYFSCALNSFDNPPVIDYGSKIGYDFDAEKYFVSGNGCADRAVRLQENSSSETSNFEWFRGQEWYYGGDKENYCVYNNYSYMEYNSSPTCSDKNSVEEAILSNLPVYQKIVIDWENLLLKIYWSADINFTDSKDMLNTENIPFKNYISETDSKVATYHTGAAEYTGPGEINYSASGLTSNVITETVKSLADEETAIIFYSSIWNVSCQDAPTWYAGMYNGLKIDSLIENFDNKECQDNNSFENNQPSLKVIKITNLNQYTGGSGEQCQEPEPEPEPEPESEITLSSGLSDIATSYESIVASEGGHRSWILEAFFNYESPDDAILNCAFPSSIAYYYVTIVPSGSNYTFTGSFLVGDNYESSLTVYTANGVLNADFEAINSNIDIIALGKDYISYDNDNIEYKVDNNTKNFFWVLQRFYVNMETYTKEDLIDNLFIVTDTGSSEAIEPLSEIARTVLSNASTEPLQNILATVADDADSVCFKPFYYPASTAGLFPAESHYYLVSLPGPTDTLFKITGTYTDTDMETTPYIDFITVGQDTTATYTGKPFYEFEFDSSGNYELYVATSSITDDGIKEKTGLDSPIILRYDDRTVNPMLIFRIITYDEDGIASIDTDEDLTALATSTKVGSIYPTIQVMA